MWIARFAVPVALCLALLFAVVAPRSAEPAASISARELLVLAQTAGGRSYTYSQATARAMSDVTVPRPAPDASREQLESALVSAGFTLEAEGRPESERIRIAHAGG